MDRSFYHISQVDIPNIFSPKVPIHRMPEEDSLKGRICVSDSIQGCLIGYPDNDDLKNEIWRISKGLHPIFYIYQTPCEKIPEQNIIHPNELHKNHGVMDAWASNEHWLVNDVLHFQEQYAIKIEGLEIEEEPFKDDKLYIPKMIKFQRSVENTDREFEYHYWNTGTYDVDSFLMYIDRSWIINKKNNQDNTNSIHFKVPAGENIQTLWRIYNRYREFCLRSSFFGSILERPTCVGESIVHTLHHTLPNPNPELLKHV